MVKQLGPVLTHVVVSPVKLVYHKVDSDFSIYGMKIVDSNYGDSNKVKLNSYNTFTLQGDIGELSIGKVYEVDLQEDIYSNYNASYQLVKFHYGFPVEAQGQWNFLYRITTNHICDLLRQKYDYDDKICDIIISGELLHADNNIKGLGPKNIDKLTSTLLKEKDKGKLYASLDYPHVTSNLINKIYHAFNGHIDKAITQIKANPYSLIDMLDNFGFVKADYIAYDMGMTADNPNRLGYGLRFLLERGAFANGNTYDKISNLLYNSVKILHVDKTLMKNFIYENNGANLAKYQLVYDFSGKFQEQTITTKTMNQAERLIAKDIKTLQERNSHCPFISDKAIQKYLDDLPDNIKLSPEQQQVFDSINNNAISILVGPAGTGKTWTIQHVVKLFNHCGTNVQALASTGRAAKILSNYTGLNAQTVHRALGIFNGDNGGSCLLRCTKPLIDEGLIIVDESSMIDTLLAQAIFHDSVNNEMHTGVRHNVHLLFIGDADQLPSVGPGNILYDLMNTKSIPTIKLTKVFRQEADSGILTLAKKIRQKESLQLDVNQTKVYLPNFDKHDTTLLNLNDKEIILEKLKQWYQAKLNEGISPIDIMVLVAKNKGILGIKSLNNVLQQIANPLPANVRLQEVPYVEIGRKAQNVENHVIFRENDLVYIKKNNYNTVKLDPDNFKPILLDSDEPETINDMYDNVATTTIVNGDFGIIKYVDFFEKSLGILINDDTLIRLKGSEINNYLSLGYCLTVHKSQGGQARSIALAFTSSDTFMLNANLLYTAITRTTSDLIIFAPFELISSSVQKFINHKRLTNLPTYLKELNKTNNLIKFSNNELPVRDDLLSHKDTDILF